MRYWLGIILGIAGCGLFLILPYTVYLAVFETSQENIRVLIYNAFLTWYLVKIAAVMIGVKEK